MEKSDNFLIIDKNGLIIEKNKNFPTSFVGHISDIVTKTGHIFDNKEKEFTINIEFENNNLVIVNNKEENGAFCFLNNAKKSD